MALLTTNPFSFNIPYYSLAVLALPKIAKKNDKPKAPLWIYHSSKLQFLKTVKVQLLFSQQDLLQQYLQI